MKYPCLLTKKINEISSAKYNPRKITDEAMGRLTKSLAEFGNIQPITWNVRTGNVVGGHQRLKVYKAMGKTEVDVWAVDLDEQKEKAANIALNKLSGEFDMPMLKDILEEIDTGDLDMEITGFGMDEIALMMEDAHPEVTEDEVPEVPVDAITKPGDLWILGEHRVLCEDSTKAENVNRLMDGERASLMLTDPPYGIGIASNPVRQKHKKQDWDAKPIEPNQFLHQCETSIVWGGNYFDLKPSKGFFVWDKKQPEDFTLSMCEMAWTNIDTPAKMFRKSVTSYSKDHPTQKPVELMAWCMGWTQGAIFDPFLGSGTTLIAAEQLGRKCYGMEISPNYCDVIVKRWENLTGKKATLAK
jgi:ParB-like chromosome segregation protein Spo0J